MIILARTARLAWRSLLRTPGFTATAVLSLALGIGLSTAVFTVADALLLRRLPVRDQDRLVMITGRLPGPGASDWALGLEDAREFARGTSALESVAFVSYYGAAPKLARDGDRSLRLHRALVSGDFFDVLGARAALGRTLRRDDDLRGAAPVVVLSHRGWLRLGGDSGVVGRRITIHEDDVTYTVAGVMPQGLDYPRGTEFWAPVVASTPARSEQYIALHLLGRLAPERSLAHARDELTSFFARPEARQIQRGMRGVGYPLPRLVLGETRPAVMAFAAAAGLLLLITCINVATLLLARGIARARELAVRSALGAARGRIVRQLLAESSLVAALGGALGALVAAGAVRAFLAFAPAGIPRLDEIALNGSALAAAICITVLALLLFSIGPAVAGSRVALQQALRSDARQSAGRRSRLVMEALVSGQIALAVIVLSAAGVITRSLVELERADLSFDASHLVVGELALQSDAFALPATQIALLDRLVPELEAIPGVESVAPVVAMPYSTGWSGRPAKEGQSIRESAANPVLNMEVVTPGYFATFGIPVLRGRAFDDADRAGSSGVAMLSESAARQYWPGADALGRRLFMGAALEHSLTVVGIVPDTRYRDLREAPATVYFPLRQSFFPFAPTTLAVRTSTEPAEVIPALRRVVSEVDPAVALASALPFSALIAEPLSQPRLNALLLAVFAGSALLLAAVGLFGVMATTVGSRTREIGVRMALGATGGHVRSMIIRRAVAVAVAGAIPGLVAALFSNRLLSAILYEVSPTDGVTLAGVTALLVLVAIIASFIPALSTTRIDPVTALRADG